MICRSSVIYHVITEFSYDTVEGFGAVEGGEGNWKGRNLAQYLLISSLFMEAVTDQRHKFKALVIKYNIDNASIPMT